MFTALTFSIRWSSGRKAEFTAATRIYIFAQSVNEGILNWTEAIRDDRCRVQIEVVRSSIKRWGVNESVKGMEVFLSGNAGR